jgi:hypothetical protein
MEPVVVMPQFWPLSSHTFYQAFQNVTVKVTSRKAVRMLFVDSGCATPFLLLVIVGCPAAIIVVLFLDHNRKSNFHCPL